MATINPLPAPINYAVEVQNPFESALGGLKLGAGVADIQATQQKREIERQALEQAQARQVDLQNLFQNPNATAADYRRVSAFLPKDQAAIVVQGFDAQNKEQQQETLSFGARAYSAIKSGNIDVAEKLLVDKAEALRNSGRKNEAATFDDYAKIIKLNPTGAQANIGTMMALLPGGDKFLENVDKNLSTIAAEEKRPFELVSTQAKSEQDVIDARFAEQIKKLGILKTEEDIIINRENARISALNAQIARETNTLKRDELKLKIDEAREKRDQADRDQQSTLKSQSADIDNFLNTAQRILNTPQAIVKSATGPIASRLPTASADVADFEGLVETLGSQAFLAQIPKLKGTGNLTEKEGDKLQTSLQNLSLKQSPARLFENVNEAMRLLGKVRTNITERSGMPTVSRDVPTVPVVRITLPDGRVAQFPNQDAADAFKKKTGIR